MAYSIVQKPNTDAPSGDYPRGNIRDKTLSVAGTPVNKLVYADMHQFFAKLMAEAGITPNGLPDNEYSGYQLFEALLAINGGLKRKTIAIGAWNMQSTALLSVAHGLTFSKIRSAQLTIINDAQDFLYTLPNTGAAGATAVINVTLVGLFRGDGGEFDSASFNDPVMNRGYIIIDYID